MIQFTVEATIGRGAAEVFAYITDPAKLATWQTNTVSATVEGDGEMRLGARLREVHRAPGGRELTQLVEVAEWEPARVFALRMLEGPLPLDARITLQPAETGAATDLAFTVHGQPQGAMRFMQPLLRHALRRQFKQHCAQLKRVLETGPA